jgi:hypothetical protein
MTKPTLLGLSLAGFTLLATPGRAGPDAPAASARGINDLAWIAGRWLDTSEGNLSEEVWTAPSGDSMLGMWRYVSAGRARIFEILTIGPGEAGLELRLRHFDPRLVGREEKQRPVVLPIVHSSAKEEAVFEGPDSTGVGTVRITYRRVGEEALNVTLEKGGSKEEFRFRRGGTP